MGAGKSTIGRILAHRIGYLFYDTDFLVMRGFGKPVSRIFTENGEKAFHTAEVMVLNELTKRQNVIISTGGGTLVRDDTFAIARGTGTLLYLRAPATDLYQRVLFSPKDRPAVDVPDTETAFLSRFEICRRYYERADVTVDTVNRRPDDVVNEILSIFSEKIQTGQALS